MASPVTNKTTAAPYPLIQEEEPKLSSPHLQPTSMTSVTPPTRSFWRKYKVNLLIACCAGLAAIITVALAILAWPAAFGMLGAYLVAHLAALTLPFAAKATIIAMSSLASCVLAIASLCIKPKRQFQTSHGSEYTLYSDNTTQRIKKDVDRAQGVNNDLGLHPRSVKTCYLTKTQDASLQNTYNTIEDCFTTEGVDSCLQKAGFDPSRLYDDVRLECVINADDPSSPEIGIELKVLLQNQCIFTNKIQHEKAKTTPEINLIPFELFNDSFHFGHPIVWIG